ncbi:MAG: MBL fold metallo-hydrolase [Thermoplasmata archaeon]|nr:MBL fold metallo-hydrolase [Thermoplasmata archaeon]
MATALTTTPGVRVEEGVGRIPGFVNIYTFLEGERIVLIDTGFSPKAKSVVKAFQASKVPLTRLGRVLLTHHHVDHMGGAAQLLQSTGAPISCHAEDAPFVDGRVKAPMPRIMRLFMKVHPAAVASMLSDGDLVGPLQVIHTPGHTPGEVVFYHPGRKILFAGDSLREQKGKLILPAARFASNIAQAVSSLQRLQRLDVALMLPGHGEPIGTDFSGLLDDLVRRAPDEYLRG